ncbi:MAG: septum site-determining protein MinC [Gammaproteobacteria bacterium]|nr:septum site-determining protein MinC [Gammaproteobacteria bacterium]
MSVTKSIELKGGMLMALTMQVFSCDLDAIEEGLQEKIAEGRDFFQNALIVIDFTKLSGFLPELPPLLQIIRSNGMSPIGYRCENPEHLLLLEEIDLPLIPSSRKEGREIDGKGGKANWLPALLHTQPVRSGQQIYAQRRDLILTAQASNGSELIADGSIHVYGALRGRALCGVSGNSEARIFCNKFDAELISIAGTYRLVDESLQHLINQAVEIRLMEDKIEIIPIDSV